MAADRLQTATKIYLASLIAIAISLMVGSIVFFGSELSRTDVPMTIIFISLMTLSWIFPLDFAAKTKLYLDTAVIIAVILLFDPPVAMVIAGGGTFLAHALRKTGHDWPEALFNTAQSVILAATGGLFLAASGWNPDRPIYSVGWPLVSLLLAGMVMQVMTVLAVTTIIALEEHQPIIGSWRQGFLDAPRMEFLAQVALFSSGVLSAIVVTAQSWALILLLAPTVAIYLSLQQQYQLRQHAEQARQTSEANLATTQRAAKIGNWEWDLTTNSQSWSAEAQRILGLDSVTDQPTLATLMRVVDAADRAAVEQAFSASQQHAKPLQISYRVRSANNSRQVVHQEAAVHLNRDGRPTKMIGTIQDVTERNALELQVASFAERERVAQELAQMRKRLSEIREDERMHLARSLHDGPVQDLIAITYQLAAVPRHCNKRHASGRSLACVLDDVRHEMLDVVGQLRSMIGELRPAGLTEFGLAAALEGYVAGLQRQSTGTIPAIFLDIASEANDLPPQQAISLFRVAQEALRNALRHADAVEVMLSIEKSDCCIRLEVHDDGRGFQVPYRLQTLSESDHFGLIGIAERVELAGGTLTIASTPSTGTTICVQLPLVASEDCDE